MKKSIFFISLCVLLGLNLKAQYDGAVGTEGCQAINQNDSRIVSWAIGVEVNRGYWDYGDNRIVTYGEPYMALGKPDSTTTRAISLGEGGTALITFDRPILNGEGKDFVVFENAFGTTFLELAFVEVSSDGVNFFRFPNQTTSFHNPDSTTEGRGAERYNNLAGKYELGWGVGFDINEIEDNELLDKNNIRFVRLVDVINGVSTDSEGNIIYDGVSWATYSQGFDLTGIGIINGGEPYKVADFENLTLQTNSFEIIDLNNYTEQEGEIYYKNNISEELNFLGTLYYSYGFPMSVGFGVSNVSDTNSTINGNSEYRSAYYISAPLYAMEGENHNYLIAYYDAWTENQHNIVKRTDNQPFYPLGCYVAKSLAAFEDLEASTTENLYFKIIATGYNTEGNITDTAQIYLYDANNNIANLKDWRYLNLASLGEVSKVVFSLECNDSYVSNYFCIDNFVYTYNNVSANENIIANNTEIKMYPNPATNYTTIETTENGKLQIFDIHGRLVMSKDLTMGANQINIQNLQQGTYLIKIIASSQITSQKLIVK